jgi:hypothetical protein
VGLNLFQVATLGSQLAEYHTRFISADVVDPTIALFLEIINPMGHQLPSLEVAVSYAHAHQRVDTGSLTDDRSSTIHLFRVEGTFPNGYVSHSAIQSYL